MNIAAARAVKATRVLNFFEMIFLNLDMVFPVAVELRGDGRSEKAKLRMQSY